MDNFILYPLKYPVKMVCFSVCKSQICRNDGLMCTFKKIYPRFWEMIEKESLSGAAGTCFEEFCRKEGVSPASFDEFLILELGFSGEEVIDIALKNY